jgi:predicted metal-dependent hydrolase
MPATSGLLVHHGESIPYQVILSRRRTLGIHIYPDRRVVIRAPKGTDTAEIAAIVEKRAAWISRHLTRLRAEAQQPGMQLRYDHGSSLPFLGQNLTLDIRPGPRTRVRRQGERLEIELSAPSHAGHVERAVESWLRRQANDVFAERLTTCYGRIGWMQVQRPALRVRRMRSRWGSCSGAGRVTLNLRLIHLPPELIDYVIYHELCHLREMNHSRRFYALMARAVPDWKQKRAQLHAYSGLLRQQ